MTPHPGVPKQYKSGSKGLKGGGGGTTLGGFGKQLWVWEEAGKGEYDQTMVYELPKELIKTFLKTISF